MTNTVHVAKWKYIKRVLLYRVRPVALVTLWGVAVAMVGIHAGDAVGLAFLPFAAVYAAIGYICYSGSYNGVR